MEHNNQTNCTSPSCNCRSRKIEKVKLNSSLDKMDVFYHVNLVAEKCNEIIDHLNALQDTRDTQEKEYISVPKGKWLCSKGPGFCDDEKCHPTPEPSDECMRCHFLEKQIDKLANYMMKEYPEEITDGGAVEVAIKVLKKLNQATEKEENECSCGCETCLTACKGRLCH